MDKNTILIELSESENVRFGKQEFDLQSVPQRVFSTIWAVEQEVNNGGFSQYFSNLSGAETAAFVVDALDTIGAPNTADICRRAIVLAFPNGLPASPDAISAAAADFSEEVDEGLDRLDSEFFAYPHNLTDLLFAFVAKHPDEFGTLTHVTTQLRD